MATSIFSKSGMTLAELIIASVLVGIVTLGLIGAEEAVRMSRQSSNRDSQLSAQLQAAMIGLSHHANLTVGDYSDTGIYQFADDTKVRICFRYASGDANSYTDDRWNCWDADKATGLLTNCEGLIAILPPTSCASSSPAIKEVPWVKLTLFDATYTTFYSVVDDSGATIPPLIGGLGEIVKNKKIAYIQLDLKSRYDTNTASDPIKNPEYTLTSRISPVGLSR